MGERSEKDAKKIMFFDGFYEKRRKSIDIRYAGRFWQREKDLACGNC